MKKLSEENDVSNDGLILAIKNDLDKIVTEEICGVVYETARLEQNEIPKKVLDEKCKSRKDSVLNVFLSFVRLQRLYFIIRSGLMGIITGLLTYAIISIFSITNFLFLIFIGLIAFVISLAISRVFDAPVIKLSNMAVSFLRRHRSLKTLVLSRL